jgi:hypothetical protein
VFDLIDRSLQGCDVWTNTPNISLLQHDHIHRYSQHAIAFDHNTNLIIAELPLPVADCPRVLMACMDTPLKVLDDLPKRYIGQMSNIDGDSQRLTVFEQINGRQ